MALAASGQPTRFLTLTINPIEGRNPAHRLRLLSHAWRVIVQRLRRRYPRSNIDYLAIVEETKLHEPHLHILLRSPYIAQSLLSDWMGEIVNSPIVDIRLIRNQREVVRYVAKYITKAPAQFGTAKRYWSSRTYEIDKTHKPERNKDRLYPWLIARVPMSAIVQEWLDRGYRVYRESDDQLMAMAGRDPPRQPFRPSEGSLRR